MVPPLALPIASFLFFVLSTALFYFFSRTVLGVAVLGLAYVRMDALLWLCSGSIDGAAILIALAFFLWFVPGLIMDLAEFRGRWERIENRILSCF